MSCLRSLTFGLAIAASAGVAYLLYPAPADSASAQVAATAAPGFALFPPSVADLSLTARPASAEGNALLAVRYAADQALPASIPLLVGQRQVALRRDDADPLRYSAVIDFDFDAFIAEQGRRQQLASSRPWTPRFDGRQHIGNAPWTFLDPAKLRDAVQRGIAIRIPRDVLLDTPADIKAPNTLMVVDRRVVEDPTRTYDVCTNAGNPSGAWTFNKLMTDIANPAVTGLDPADFVEGWMQRHAGASTVNGFAVAGSPGTWGQVLANWPRLANGKLNLARSPMRLLAIVNRMDLRDNASYGGGNAGEGRFVFGVVQPQAGGGCADYRINVILEYGIPLRGCPAVRSYAQQWAGLGSLSLGSAGYNAALQNVTNRFAAANAAPGKPNRSAINQVRTNEAPLHPFWAWRLREDRLDRTTGRLLPVPVKQTPDMSFNGTGSASAHLYQYVNANAAAILAGVYDVPASYLGSPFLGGDTVTSPIWSHASIANNDARHKFSLNTCGACHGDETLTDFQHVAGRAAGAESALSDFLTGAPAGGSLANPQTYTLNDAVAGAASPRQYGDLAFRQASLSTLVNSACLSGGLLADLHFFPIAAAASH